MMQDTQCTAPTRQHELHRTDQMYLCALKDLDHELLWRPVICHKCESFDLG